MRLLYVKPELRDLSQGSRIAFVRQLRHLSQDYVSEYLGLTGECKRRSMTRYKKGDRNPKDERVKKIAELLNVNFNSLKKYNFQNQEDLIYMLLWMEEQYPRMSLDFNILEYLQEQNKLLLNFMDEWNYMRKRKDNQIISYEEYLEWKINYKVKEDSNE